MFIGEIQIDNFVGNFFTVLSQPECVKLADNCAIPLVYGVHWRGEDMSRYVSTRKKVVLFNI